MASLYRPRELLEPALVCTCGLTRLGQAAGRGTGHDRCCGAAQQVDGKRSFPDSDETKLILLKVR
jgi:hypothetical protein